MAVGYHPRGPGFDSQSGPSQIFIAPLCPPSTKWVARSLKTRQKSDSNKAALTCFRVIVSYPISTFPNEMGERDIEVATEEKLKEQRRRRRKGKSKKGEEGETEGKNEAEELGAEDKDEEKEEHEEEEEDKEKEEKKRVVKRKEEEEEKAEVRRSLKETLKANRYSEYNAVNISEADWSNKTIGYVIYKQSGMPCFLMNSCERFDDNKNGDDEDRDNNDDDNDLHDDDDVDEG
ncbi:hypothetical protein PoB_003818900 [Plakobranchus ocellatus]|uniref:Uncharacterized protein n=1 Tax=Plakobranchus ocellatus TaxID=259542 RepID=A0AAV4B004_9GAST|nr:hypothetical protein PoB_003818900 [Plakobranchus ocellatus]